jgi:hypothetical protein
LDYACHRASGANHAFRILRGLPCALAGFLRVSESMSTGAQETVSGSGMAIVVHCSIRPSLRLPCHDPRNRVVASVNGTWTEIDDVQGLLALAVAGTLQAVLRLDDGHSYLVRVRGRRHILLDGGATGTSAYVERR